MPTNYSTNQALSNCELTCMDFLLHSFPHENIVKIGLVFDLEEAFYQGRVSYYLPQLYMNVKEPCFCETLVHS